MYGQEMIKYWSSKSRVDWVLIGKKTFILTTLDPYKIILKSTRPLVLDHQYLITSRGLLGFSIAT